jgi:hypothetical protein
MELIGRLLIGGLLALGVIAWLRRRWGAPAATDPDVGVIQQLEKVGFDLSEPHPWSVSCIFRTRTPQEPR